MAKNLAFKTKTAIALALIAIAVEANCLFTFTCIDKIVHNDLYSYGLIFAQEWAAQYWAHSSLLIYSFAVSMGLTALAAASILIYRKKGGTNSRAASYMLLTAGTLATVFAFYNFTRLDYIIHHNLYQYGLHFSPEWATKYWIYAGLTSALALFAAAARTTSTTLIFLGAAKTSKTELPKLASSILIAIGAASLILSILYTTPVLAFIGLGLTFWSIILAYIQPEEYVKRNLLEAAILPTLATLNQILQELNFEGKAVYLPPKYLKNQEESKAYIPKQKTDPIPTPEQTIEQENKLFSKNPNGMLLKPPGAELAKLFEKTFETPLIRINLQEFQQNMPKLFTEDLEIAQNLEITTEKDKIHVKLENSNIQNLTEETEKLPKIHKSLGCPITSAIACALAKVTGKPVTIENQKLIPETKTLEIEYRLIEEEE